MLSFCFFLSLDVIQPWVTNDPLSRAVLLFMLFFSASLLVSLFSPLLILIRLSQSSHVVANKANKRLLRQWQKICIVNYKQ